MELIIKLEGVTGAIKIILLLSLIFFSSLYIIERQESIGVEKFKKSP